MLSGLCAGGTPNGTITNISGTAPSVTFIGAATSITNSVSSYNFGSFTAASNGIMVVLFMLADTVTCTVSSISIGGANGTLSATAFNTSHKAVVANRGILSGANNVTVTLSGTNGTSAGCAVGVYLVTGYTPPIGITDANAVNGLAGGTSNTTTIDNTIAGAWMAGSMHENNNATSWNVGSSDYDANLNNTVNRRFSFAHGTTTTGIGSLAITASWTGSNNNDNCGAMFT